MDESVPAMRAAPAEAASVGTASADAAMPTMDPPVVALATTDGVNLDLASTELPPDVPPMNGAATNGATPGGEGGPRTSTCTTAQLRRFIKSRSYLPMHELRRRFAIEGTEDDVTGVDMRGTWVFVGLPDREGAMLGELLRGGEVGYELSHDPVTPVIVGVFPMRPIPRS